MQTPDLIHYENDIIKLPVFLNIFPEKKTGHKPFAVVE